MDLKTLFKNKKFYFGLFLLIFGIVLTSLTSNYITNNFNPPVLEDLILGNIVFLRLAWIFDILSILVTLILVIYLFNGNLKQFPYFLVMFGILYTIRAIFIVLTPLGNPGAGNNPLFTGATFLAGLYFSGHIAEAFLAFLLVNKKLFKIIFLVLLFTIMFFLLVARGHYTIDLLSGLVFAYAISAFGQNYLRSKLVINRI